MNGNDTDTFIEWMCPENPENLKQLEADARMAGVPVVRKSAQNLICFFMNLLKPDRVLEIGSGIGFSAILMRNESPCRILSVELDPERAKKARENVEKAGFSEDIRILNSDAGEVLKDLSTGTEEYDLVFLDGPKGQYGQYLPHIEKLIRPGGVLIADNLLKEGEILRSRYAVPRRDRTIHSRMRDFIWEIAHSDKWSTLMTGDGDGMLAAVRK